MVTVSRLPPVSGLLLFSLGVPPSSFLLDPFSLPLLFQCLDLYEFFLSDEVYLLMSDPVTANVRVTFRRYRSQQEVDWRPTTSPR